MQYHIQTTPIWDAFKSDCECPLCEIYEKITARLVGQYLNEAVMEPDYRIKVNKFGFCKSHFLELYQGANKLGLALQVHTRTEAVLSHLKAIDNIKVAKKQIEFLNKSASTCVICDQADEMMTRYAYTIAQMFKHETDFPIAIEGGRGFCLNHYKLLLENAAHAGSATSAYLQALSTLQIHQMERMNRETEWFTLKFDYRNNSKGWGTSRDALPRGINKLKGKIVKPTVD